MTLRDRCKAWLNTHQRNMMMRVGDPVQHLEEFVVSELGRKQSKALTNASALVVYFADDMERQEFIEMWQDCHPGSRTKNLP